VPHLVLDGGIDADTAAAALDGEHVSRWGRAVLKTDGCWVRRGGGSLLVEGVVVEFSRPQHPVALVSCHPDHTTVRLWSTVPVERTPPVQRWLAELVHRLQAAGAGPVRTTNIPDDVWIDLELRRT
jgi:hypothetical protein